MAARGNKHRKDERRFQFAGTRRGRYSVSRSLIQANRRSSARVTLQDPRPRFGKHVLGLRLSARPSDHAFRPRLSHAFQPRLSATLSGHVFRRAIRIEDVVFLVTTIFQASEPWTDTVISDLVVDVIDRHEGLVADVHLHIANRRHVINMSIPKRSKPFHRQRDLLQDANIPSHTT